MIFNRIQMLRNKPIKIARDKKDSYLYVQGPTIGEIYEDDKLFLAIQILLMSEKELKEFIDVEDPKANKIDLLKIMLNSFQEKDFLLEKMQKIILGLNIKSKELYVDTQLLKIKELERIKEILQIIMGQKNAEEKQPEGELSPEEKRIQELEEKIKSKKTKDTNAPEDKDTKDNTIEDIMAAVIYEFGFDFEKIMNMNYFTLIWYYSYTGKLHVYRINQHAIGSGMVKKINTDYFTNLK